MKVETMIRKRLKNLKLDWFVFPCEKDDLKTLRDIISRKKSLSSASGDEIYLVRLCEQRIRRIKRIIRHRRIRAISELSRPLGLLDNY